MNKKLNINQEGETSHEALINSSQRKTRYKMYKAGKQWMFVGILSAILVSNPSSFINLSSSDNLNNYKFISDTTKPVNAEITDEKRIDEISSAESYIRNENGYSNFKITNAGVNSSNNQLLFNSGPTYGTQGILLSKGLNAGNNANVGTRVVNLDRPIDMMNDISFSVSFKQSMLNGQLGDITSLSGGDYFGLTFTDAFANQSNNKYGIKSMPNSLFLGRDLYWDASENDPTNSISHFNGGQLYNPN
ncbi:MAG: KxYKxGKxW signal peptide domain-containing protein, partial [Lactobacillaceae bacterium]|nr:KxYKxGKxW signal peptide domain-containing protein [Lactobacillaceae bacterium]